MMENNEFGDREYQPLPQNNPPKQDIKEHIPKANQIYGAYGKQIVDKKTYNLLKAFIIILGVAVVIFGLLAWNGNIGKDLVCQGSNFTCPDLNCPSLNCPEVSCGSTNLSCGDVNIPDKIFINGS